MNTDNTKGKRFRLARLLSGSALILSGCGTTYAVDKVASFDKETNVPGIYYALPKTDILIEAVAPVSTVHYGRFYSGLEAMPSNPKITFQQRFKDNGDLCRVSKTNPKVIDSTDTDRTGPDPSDKMEFSFGARSRKDAKQVYRLNVDPGMFASYKHTIELAENGTIKSADTTIKDGATQFVQKTVTGLLSIATTNLADMSGNKAGGDKITYCKDLDSARAKQATMAANLKVLKDKRAKAALVDASRVATGSIGSAAAKIDKDIAVVEAAKKIVDALFEKTVLSRTVYVGNATYEPMPFQQEATGAALKWKVLTARYEKAKDDTTPARIPTISFGAVLALSEATGEEADSVRAKLSAMKLIVTSDELSELVQEKADPKGCTKQDRVIKDEEDKDKKVTVRNCGDNLGYRYRFPVVATVTLKDTADRATADLSIAQYGPILAMPGRFGGSEASILLTYSDVGSLSKAVVGSTPQAGDSASSYLDAYAKYREAQIKADTAAQTKADADAAKDAKSATTALLAEKDYLDALKQVQALRKELGIPE